MSASAPAVNVVTLVGTSPPTRSSSSSTTSAASATSGSRSTTRRTSRRCSSTSRPSARRPTPARSTSPRAALSPSLGRLVYREWDDNGTRRSRHHVVGRVQFGGRPGNGDQPSETDDSGEEAADF